MKNQLIGAFVAALILFIWQFLSWTPVLNLHSSQMAYTPKQDAVLAALAAAELPQGDYFMPQAPPDAPKEQMEAMMNEQIGKPWAFVSYHSSMSNNMGMNMLRAFIINFLGAFLLVWLFMKMANLDMKTCLLGSLAVGFIGYLTITYLNSIWFEQNSIPNLIDAVVQWGAVGLWLGWWLPSRM